MTFKPPFRLTGDEGRPSRSAVLSDLHRSLYQSIAFSENTAKHNALEWEESKVGHPLLLRLLQADPSTSAILPTVQVPIALGFAEHAPFMVTRSGLLLLPPALLGSSGALAVATRWGLEAAQLVGCCSSHPACIRWALGSTLRHGAALLQLIGQDDRMLILDLLPDWVAEAIAGGDELKINARLLAWQASRIEILQQAAGWFSEPGALPSAGELSLPLEYILAADGDSRLAIDPQTGLNRYGTVPRPRPEAVHFSSSTASSVSDYGFTLCEALRQDLLRRAIREGVPIDELHHRFTDAVIAQLLTLLKIDCSETDFVLAPSGSDTELLAVMLAVAAADAPLTNVLIAPEETGRAVALAGAGRFFDELAGSGAPVCKGEEAWPGRPIEVRQVAIRGQDGLPRPIAEIEAELRNVVTTSLARGHRVLLHLLACSKTGLSAPSTEGLRDLVAIAPDRIDVVVDACQMRTPLEKIAQWVQLGWMTQLSGSKFFTGPPFSGALTIPPCYRARAARVRALLAAARGVGRPEDWSSWWRPRLAPENSSAAPGLGFLFRWVPAIAEAHLLAALPSQLCRDVFDCFRSSIVSRLAHSKFLSSIAPPDARPSEPQNALHGQGPTDLSTRSIVCFTVTVQDRPGQPRTLDTRECQRLFELLNIDLSQHLESLSPAEQVIAAQCAHIGQPVTLSVGPDQRELSILRMVIGARFFTIIGYARRGAVEAALASEIADAVRAIDKLELLAERWTQIRGLAAIR